MENKLDGRYIVLEEIGSGGFGAVYLAEDTRFGGNNKVAIKKIVHKNEMITKSFRQEADLLYNLSHPNLPKVTNCFQQDGASFIVMDFITGEDLAEKLKKVGKFSVGEVLHIADTVLGALEYLHSFSIFHRDIKPHNIKIDESGRIFLLDFGTAKGSFDDENLTQNTDQSIIGYTPFYAPLEQMLRIDANSYLLLQSTDSPHLEQFLEKKTDARSDIFSLGATLYHLLTGFSPEKATATVRAFAIWSGKNEPLPDCRSLNPEISDQLANIINRCMEILPKDRFQTAAELREALNNQSRTLNLEVESDKTIPILTGKIPTHEIINAEKTDENSIPPSLKNKPGQSPEVQNKYTAEDKKADSFSKTSDLSAFNSNQAESKKNLYVFGGIGVVLLLALVGFAGVFVVKSLIEKSDKKTLLAANTNPKESNKPPLPEDEPSRTMDYSLLVQKMRDGKKFQEPFESSGQEIFESGYQFQMRFTPPENGYLYVFNEGLDKNGEKIFNIIFPTPLRNEGKAEVSSGKSYESGWNEFAGNPGTENFWFIWCKEKNEMLENSREDAFESETGELTDGDLKSKLKEFLDEKSKSETELSKDFKKQYSQIKFKGDTAVHLIKLEHR